jgi:carbon monoxide dehydrogenase subunit G
MRLNEVLEIGASPDHVGRQLGKPAVLRALLPGEATVRETGPGAFDFTLRKTLGFLEMRQSGQIRLITLAPRQLRLTLHAAHLIGGSVDLQVIVSLVAKGRGTEIGYDGTLDAAGLAGRLLRDREGQVRPYVARIFGRLKAEIEATPA